MRSAATYYIHHVLRRRLFVVIVVVVVVELELCREARVTSAGDTHTHRHTSKIKV